MTNNIKKNTIIHSLDESENKKNLNNLFVLPLMFLSVLIFGVFSGWFIAQIYEKKENNQKSLGQKIEVKKTAGIVDKKTFKDTAEGVLREGGIDGEGQFHLERPGGPSQNVYLTSTTVDLSQFIGKKIRVWGETFSAQKAGWLMNVGFVEIL